MSSIQSALTAIDSFIWGPPLLILLVGTGIYLTLRLGLLQVVRLPLALRLVFGRDQGQGKQGDVSSFGALCTALSATIGTGNIVGVATAIKLGGPGALVLDVDGGTVRHGHQVCRVPAGGQIPRAGCQRPDGWRPHVLSGEGARLQAAGQAICPVRHRCRLLRHRYLPAGQCYLRRYEPLLLGAP